MPRWGIWVLKWDLNYLKLKLIYIYIIHIIYRSTLYQVFIILYQRFFCLNQLLTSFLPGWSFLGQNMAWGFLSFFFQQNPGWPLWIFRLIRTFQEGPFGNWTSLPFSLSMQMGECMVTLPASNKIGSYRNWRRSQFRSAYDFLLWYLYYLSFVWELRFQQLVQLCEAWSRFCTTPREKL